MSSLAVAVRATAHTLRSIYLKQMLSDAAPLCGGKMRPTRSIPSLSLCSFPVSLPRCSFPLSPLEPYPLFSSLTLRLPSPLFRLYSLSPAAVVQPGVLPPRPKCFLLAVHPTPSLPLSLLSSVHASCRNWGPGSNRSWISTDLIDTQSLENREPVFSFFFSLNRESMELVEISSGGNGEERMRWLDEKFLETGEGKVA